ncbi:hypothetical protein GW813_05930 [bacterium]|nr:hypothetical protein [bacterium]
MEPEILIDALVQLAGLEGEMAVCRARLTQSERMTERLLGLDREYAADTATADRHRSQAQVRQHSAEIDLAAAEESLARKRRQLDAATDARSVAALEREISGIIARQEELLEEACRLLDQESASKKESAQACEDQLVQERKAATRLQRIAVERDQATAALPEIAAEVQRLADILPGTISRHLKRLWDRGEVGVVYGQDGACTGCGARLTPQQDQAVQHGREVVRCASCARFVVHRPWR